MHGINEQDQPVQSCMTDSSAALIVGFTIQGLAIARALSKADVTVYALEKSLRPKRVVDVNPLACTDCATFFESDRLLGLELVDTLLTCRGDMPEDRVVLFPTSDNTVKVLAEYWEQLESKYLLSWSECRQEVWRVIQKGALPEYCEAAGVSYPKTAVVSDESDKSGAIEALKFPVLVKPNKPASSFKTHICNDPAELVNFLEHQRANWPLVVQEWIDGPDDSLYAHTCFVHDGAEVFGLSSRKVRASPPGLGRATVIETFQDSKVHQESRKLIEVFGVSGPISTEFKRDRNGKYWFIEANVGRTEYCVDLAIEAGFNLPLLEFARATDGTMPPVASVPDEVVWYDTDKEPFCYWAFCLRQKSIRPFGKRAVFPYFRKERMVVVLAAFLAAIIKLMGRAIAKISAISGGTS